jgi:hypothetical protein
MIMGRLIKSGSVVTCPHRRNALIAGMRAARGENTELPEEKVVIGTVFTLDKESEVEMRINFSNLRSILIAIKVDRDEKDKIKAWHSPFIGTDKIFHVHDDIDRIRGSLKLVVKEFVSDIPKQRARVLPENWEIFKKYCTNEKIALAP